jgi:hypothetical protein
MYIPQPGGERHRVPLALGESADAPQGFPLLVAKEAVWSAGLNAVHPRAFPSTAAYESTSLTAEIKYEFYTGSGCVGSRMH